MKCDCDSPSAEAVTGASVAHQLSCSSLRRTCEREGCERKTRNEDERRCIVHEDRETYERYQASGYYG
jgi:hypothetical protein